MTTETAKKQVLGDNAMELRQLTSEDRESFARLARYAFDPTKNSYEEVIPENLDSSPWLKDMSEVYGWFDNDILVSAAAFFESSIIIRNREFPMGGVWGVCTSPHYRNQSLIRNLFQKMFEEMRYKQLPISVLYPFKFSFYEQFGYKLVDEIRRHHIRLDEIITRPIPARSVREVAVLDDIKKIYYRIAGKKYNYMVKRTERDWRRRIDPKKPGYFFVCYDDQDEPCGYMLLRFEEKGANDFEKSEQTIYLPEMFWLDRETRQALFNFLKAHADHRKYALFSSADPDILAYVNNPRIKQNAILAGSMARIIDVESVLRAFDYLKSCNLILKIQDNQCPWNNKAFTFDVESGQLILEETSKAADVTLDIGALTQMIAGYRNASRLYESWEIDCSSNMLSVLDQLFPVQNNFIRDFF
ncbi:MAG: enhanced intracellular survival protein Eis [Candidatus Hodarchaeota archaeon]